MEILAGASPSGSCCVWVSGASARCHDNLASGIWREKVLGSASARLRKEVRLLSEARNALKYTANNGPEYGVSLGQSGKQAHKRICVTNVC